MAALNLNLKLTDVSADMYVAICKLVAEHENAKPKETLWIPATGGIWPPPETGKWYLTTVQTGVGYAPHILEYTRLGWMFEGKAVGKLNFYFKVVCYTDLPDIAPNKTIAQISFQPKQSKQTGDRKPLYDKGEFVFVQVLCDSEDNKGKSLGWFEAMVLDVLVLGTAGYYYRVKFSDQNHETLNEFKMGYEYGENRLRKIERTYNNM